MNGGVLPDRFRNAETTGLVLVVLTLLFLLSPLGLFVPPAAVVFVEVGVVFLLYGLLVLGLNLQFGYTGLVNFGHVVFFAVGAYAMAMVTVMDPRHGVGMGLGWPVGLLAAVLAATILGAAVGVTTLRLRDDFLAISTLAVAEIFHDFFSTFESITGGDTGLLGVPQPIRELSDTNQTMMAASLLLFLGVVLVVYGGIRRLTDAPYGRVLRAIRDDEQVVDMLGKNVFRYKMESFVYGAALAGLAGGLYALYLGAVAPGFFTLDVTVIVWVGMLIGGPRNNWGVVVGLGIIMGFQLASRFLHGTIPVSQSDFGAIRLMLIGLLLVVIIRYKPAGLWGNPNELGVER